MTVILISLYLIFSSSALILIKKGSINTNFGFELGVIQMQINPILIIGLLFYILSFIFWTLLLKFNNLSSIMPFTSGLSYAIVLFLSFFVLNEKINFFQSIGIAIVFIGIIFMNIKP